MSAPVVFPAEFDDRHHFEKITSLLDKPRECVLHLPSAPILLPSLIQLQKHSNDVNEDDNDGVAGKCFAWEWQRVEHGIGFVKLYQEWTNLSGMDIRLGNKDDPEYHYSLQCEDDSKLEIICRLPTQKQEQLFARVCYQESKFVSAHFSTHTEKNTLYKYFDMENGWY